VGIFDRLERLADQLGDLITPDDVRAHVELGAAYLERGELEAAINELTLATELRPEHARALYLLGLAYGRRGDHDSAIAALSRAAAVRAGFAEAHVALGELYRRRGDVDTASEQYRRALESDLGSPSVRGEVYRGLGAAYLHEGRFDKAVRELRKAVASLPSDGGGAEAQALLGRALFLRGDADAARVCLEKAVSAAEPDPVALETLADLYQRATRSDEAAALYQRLLSAGEPLSARLGLARLALDGGRTAEAHEQVMRALAVAPDRADVLALLGRVHAASGSWEPALSAYDRALVAGAADPRLLADRRPLLEAALRLALRADLVARAAGYASVLLADQPAHADAQAAVARQALAQGELEHAQALAQAALAAGDTVETRLADAEVALAAGHGSRAAASLRRAAQLAQPLADPRPRARLAELYRAERERAPRDLYALLQLTHRHLSRTRELAELGPEAGRLLEVLDRPLLVTVMGEFNAGKSTFVNALLGEEVAPMGITPTTATINVLKYGAERKGRVVWLDDARAPLDVPWQEVPALLKGLGAEQAKQIRAVEVLYPLEILQRVNVVDTPGLNSIQPEHEATARRFIAEADAVVWLFTVDQAAKATEGAALDKIKAEGKKVLGVLNKIDRCTPGELERVRAHVLDSVGAQLETVVPFAAKRALTARRSGDAPALAQSNYDALAQTLEERFFSRARAIQRDAARTRLAELLHRAQALAAPLGSGARLDALDTAIAAVLEDAARFREQFLRQERSRLLQASGEVSRMAAREVLDFVRPRRWPLGSNQASPADRDFLLGLLDERLGLVLDAARARVEAEVERTLAIVRSVQPESDFSLHLRLLDEQVYVRFRAFARGLLRGGRVDDFFTRVLPKLELTEAAIQRALERDSPWSEEHSAAELRQPLAAWAERFHAVLAERLEQARARAELERFDLEERVIAPLEVLTSALGALQPADESSTA
jgi:small GTP-binding protein